MSSWRAKEEPWFSIRAVTCYFPRLNADTLLAELDKLYSEAASGSPSSSHRNEAYNPETPQ